MLRRNISLMIVPCKCRQKYNVHYLLLLQASYYRWTGILLDYVTRSHFFLAFSMSSITDQNRNKYSLTADFPKVPVVWTSCPWERITILIFLPLCCVRGYTLTWPIQFNCDMKFDNTIHHKKWNPFSTFAILSQIYTCVFQGIWTIYIDQGTA